MSEARSSGDPRGKSEEIKKYKLVQHRNGDDKYNTGNIVNNTEVTMHAARWVLEASGDHSMKDMIF